MPCAHVYQERKEYNKEEKAEGKEKVNTLRKLLIGFIRFWQVFISPLYPPSCRYYPTCSQYAIMSVEKYGPIKGSIKALWRIIRCNPLSRGGVDYP
ncbi:MAG: membrane protein insertion efficiency factor YidD [Acidobacteria bacterium]|nr:MAG: membrane protein insertion efficiency factor YidD [Acidobacteriota bacterium]